ncbi:MAG: hypothetical protein AAGC55_14415 [Myxococcota bacterium]
MIKPSHGDMLAAAQRAGDKELEGLLADPDSYILRTTEMTGVEYHQIFRVVFVDTDHPMSFWLATDTMGNAATVLSQNLAGVHAFLRAESALLSGDGLPERFHDLYRHQGVQSKLLDTPRAVVERSAGDVHLKLAVQSDGDREVWKIALPAQGEPSLTVEPLQ